MQEPAQDFTAREEEISQPDVPPEQPRQDLRVLEGGAAKPSLPTVPEIVEPGEATVSVSSRRPVDTVAPGLTPAAEAARRAYENQPPGPPLPPTPEPAAPAPLSVGAESSPAPQAADARAAEISTHKADLSPAEAAEANIRTVENLAILAEGVRKKSEDLRTIKAESDAQFAAAMNEIDALVQKATEGIPKKSGASSPPEPTPGDEIK